MVLNRRRVGTDVCGKADSSPALRSDMRVVTAEEMTQRDHIFSSSVRFSVRKIIWAKMHLDFKAQSVLLLQS